MAKWEHLNNKHLKKLLPIVAILAVVLTGCKKDESPENCSGVGNVSDDVEVLMNGQTACYLEGVSYTLYVPAGMHDTYVWSTGESSATISVNEAGYYYVTVANSQSGDESFHEVSISDQCEAIYVPNAFTPNGDGINEDFRPVGANICQYHLWISDLDGVALFETEDLNEGWDGRYEGKPVDPGMYVWDYEITFVNGESQENTGFVELLR